MPSDPWRYVCPIHGRRVRLRGLAADCDGDDRWGHHTTLIVRDLKEDTIVRTDGVGGPVTLEGMTHG